MPHHTLFSLLVLCMLFVCAFAQCSSVDQAPNICQYTVSTLIVASESNCRDVNNDIFDFDFTGQADCEALIREDGNDCMEAWGIFACSQGCSNCPFDNPYLVCNSVCDNTWEKCPSADQAGCFVGFAETACDNNDNQCSIWGADLSKQPNPTPSPSPSPPSSSASLQ
eukprot:CAMPEP_0177632692 /NCGR_PEP_ID=MMETSP0447-20121125/2439_1 /TAXON_ID=0 /ORGANISM="Stygamoeba regulata, Strain BSH-02190019" /LENGTH=166 /DNA_ID=CAMNT_0019134301 /DNA_START=129 /DNA_END=626 /DNA_ORIENTATION=-